MSKIARLFLWICQLVRVDRMTKSWGNLKVMRLAHKSTKHHLRESGTHMLSNPFGLLFLFL